MHLGDEDVKRRKDEIIEWEEVIVWGRIPRLELSGGGVRDGKNFAECEYSP
jgi:hypothetical protein